jgi:hypothetical protein
VRGRLNGVLCGFRRLSTSRVVGLRHADDEMVDGRPDVVDGRGQLGRREKREMKILLGPFFTGSA